MRLKNTNLEYPNGSILVIFFVQQNNYFELASPAAAFPFSAYFSGPQAWDPFGAAGSDGFCRGQIWTENPYGKPHSIPFLRARARGQGLNLNLEFTCDVKNSNIVLLVRIFISYLVF